MKAKEIFKSKLFLAAIVMVLITVTGSFLCLKDNFHVITKGEAYRSAQLDRDELKLFVKKYNIKSVLNLRGSNPDNEWYSEEMKASSDLKIAHYDIALSATRELTAKEVAKIIVIFRTAPRPLLQHCKAGADRSGLVAAMWKVIVDHEPKSEAGKQLSIVFGHIPIGGTSAMDRFFDSWNPALN